MMAGQIYNHNQLYGNDSSDDNRVFAAPGMRVLVFGAFLMLSVSCGIGWGGTIEKAPMRSVLYIPDEIEDKIIESLTSDMNSSGISATFDPRISLAIYNTLNEKDPLLSGEITASLKTAGEKVTILPFDPQIDTEKYGQIWRSILDPGDSSVRLSLATIKSGGEPYLVVCMTGMNIVYDRINTYRDGSIPQFPGMLSSYKMRHAGTVNTDSIICVLYRGENQLRVEPDNIIMADMIPVENDSILVEIKGEKDGAEAITLNIYGLNRTSRKYELIAIDYAPVRIYGKRGGENDGVQY